MTQDFQGNHNAIQNQRSSENLLSILRRDGGFCRVKWYPRMCYPKLPRSLRLWCPYVSKWLSRWPLAMPWDSRRWTCPEHALRTCPEIEEHEEHARTCPEVPEEGNLKAPLGLNDWLWSFYFNLHGFCIKSILIEQNAEIHLSASSKNIHLLHQMFSNLDMKSVFSFL